MDGLERIHQQVLREAQDEARQIEQAAQSLKESVLQREQTKADELYEAALDAKRKELQGKRSQLRAQLSMTERKSLLETKQEWIHRVLAESLQSLANRPAEEKLADYAAMLEAEEIAVARREQGEDLPVQIELCRQDAALVEDLRKNLPYLAEVTANRDDFCAGLRVCIGLIHFNYTYEEILRRHQDDLIAQVGQILFA